MKTLKLSALLMLLTFSFQLSAHDLRQTIKLDKNWKFTREDSPSFKAKDYNDKKWQSVTVPHDWAIYGPFDRNNDLQVMAITQDGQVQKQEHTGRTGGLPFVGAGWYRTQVDVKDFTKGKKAFLLFDGAMSNPEVFVNGENAGGWAYGYNSFFLDVTKFLKDDVKNTVAVRLENKDEFSRWYPGAGLYRNVYLIITEDAYIPIWGTQLTTPFVSKEFSKVNLKTKVDYPSNTLPQDYTLETTIVDKDGKEVAKETKQLTKFSNNLFEQELIVENPKFWTLNDPYLYKAKSKLFYKGKEKDNYETTFGVRTIEIIPDKGFFLNGERTVFKGVCLHHDLGPLGGAVNEAAIRRQIRLLKEMGANAIRTSHNMPAPELVKACDEMGMMVMVETFDEWKSPKMKNGYNTLYDEWAEKDLINTIHQFRNDPSVVMWCIGNEVPDQYSKNGAKLALELQEICKREDPTRFVTQGMDAPDAVINNNFAATMEVLGFNYRPHKYQEAYDKLPQRIILGTETTSTVSSRGVYKFPVVRAQMKKYDDHQSSSYDVEHCGWSNLPEDDFMQHEDRPYCIGEFVWTGFDYLGEPTPYYTDWPSHSSLFGILDLAGIPKDRYYLYRSHWNKDKETLHILPHWNWEGREGEVTPIFVYTNHPSAELFINGKSQGVRTKDKSITIENSSSNDLERQKRYRLMWNDVVYEPGEVKVVAYNDKNEPVAEETIRTAGKPYALKLTADRQVIEANGDDLSFITVEVVDKDRNICPTDDRLVEFKVTGEGTYRAGANGNAASLDIFHLPKMHLFSGKLVAIVQSTDKVGEIVLDAKAKGLKGAKISIQTK